MKKLIKSKTAYPEIETIAFCSISFRKEVVASIQSVLTPILASISSRDITKSMVRVRSSNIWSYTINVRDRKNTTGDVYVQFKNEHGGPGDIYVLYDVPTKIYRKWVAAPSKGHFYWQYLRNNYYYSKLTGDKRGKLKNAINH